MFKTLALLPFLVATAFGGEILAAAAVPLAQHTHEQNTATGEYGFSYSGGPSAKTEFRALDGTTTGAYSYVDANGILQTVNYIADEFGFRAAGSNIPSGLVPLDEPEVAAAKAAHLAEHSRATQAAIHSLRKKRGIYAAAAPLLAPAAIPVAHSLPLATSSQSHVQIHKNARIIEEHPIYAPAHALLYRKKRGIYAAAPLIAPALPVATSSQSRFQIHNNAHIIQEHHPIYAPAHALLLRKRRSLAYAAPLYHTTTITEHLPYSSSSQSRFQIHKDAKIIQEYHEPIYAAAPVAAAPVAPVAPIVEAKAALPLAVPATPLVQHLPYSSSSQSRFQIHKGAKIIQEYHEPIYAAAPVAPVAPIVEAKAAALPLAAVPATPIVDHLPYSASSQNRFQIHNNAKIYQEYHQPLYAAAAAALPAAPVALAPAPAPIPAEPALAALPANEYLPTNEYLPAKVEYPSAPAAPAAPISAPAEASVSEDAVSVESA